MPRSHFTAVAYTARGRSGRPLAHLPRAVHCAPSQCGAHRSPPLQGAASRGPATRLSPTQSSTHALCIIRARHSGMPHGSVRLAARTQHTGCSHAPRPMATFVMNAPHGETHQPPCRTNDAPPHRPRAPSSLPCSLILAPPVALPECHPAAAAGPSAYLPAARGVLPPPPARRLSPWSSSRRASRRRLCACRRQSSRVQ